MSKQASLSLIAAVVLTIVITGLGLLIAVMSSMTTTAGTGGISAVTAGVSQNVFRLLMIAAPVLLVLLFLVFRKVLGSRG